MKKLYQINLLGVGLLLCHTLSFAQSGKLEQIKPSSVKLKEVSDTLQLDMKLSVGGIDLGKMEQMTVTPKLVGAAGEHYDLNSFVIAGKMKQRYDSRNALLNKRQLPQYLSEYTYSERIPFADWMESAKLVLDGRIIGCESSVVGISSRVIAVFFPAYNGIEEMFLQTKGGSLFRQVELFNESTQLPILYYGTSITHGACASIYSQSYTALSLLELKREVINIGLNGSGMSNEQMVDFVVQQPSAAFVVDVVWNMGNVPDRAEVERRVKSLITRYRQTYPSTPILLMSKFNKAAFAPGSAWEEVLFKKIYLDLREAGITELYFQPRGDVSYLQWGGGTHPNNAGMRTVADIINRRLNGMLSGETLRKPKFNKYSGDNFYTTGTDNNLYIDGYSGVDSIDLTKILPAGFIGEYTKIKVIEPSGTKKYIDVEQLPSTPKIKVRYADRDHLGYSTKVIITDDITCEDAEFNIVAQPVMLPTVTVAGREWMIFNNMSLSRQTAMADNMAVAQLARGTSDIEQILAEKDVNKYEKLVGHFYNYNKTVPATRVGGKPKVSPAGNPCPPGFELPTLADYRKLIGIPSLNINKVGAVYLNENVGWKSADKGTSIILANGGAFANGTIPRVSTSVKYTKVTRDGVSLYFINNGAFNADNANLLYDDKSAAVLTQTLSGGSSVRICFGRYDWPVEANHINYSASGYTGARCVKKLNYQTEPLKN